MGMTISSLAEAAGVNVATVRYYERRGIIANPPRTSAGYRQYDESVVDRIRFVRRAQGLGFGLDEIEELLDLRVHEPESCSVVAEATQAKLVSVESKIRELERLKGVLQSLVRACQQREQTRECPVLAMLEEGEQQ